MVMINYHCHHLSSHALRDQLRPIHFVVVVIIKIIIMLSIIIISSVVGRELADCPTIIIHYDDNDDHYLMIIHNDQLTICLCCREEIEDVAQSVHDLMGR